VKRNYEEELLQLPATYRRALDADASVADAVADAVRAPGPTVYVGSGGALAVARLAADLHIRATGHLAVATTPMDSATSWLSPDTGLVLFTARGRHPDAALAITSARARGAAHLGVVSARARGDLPPSLAAPDVRVATVPAPPDGFLATNTLLAMATAVCLAHGADLPPVLPAFDAPTPRAVRASCLTLFGPGMMAVGVDLEARLVETGLAGVQLTDYRNIAHGRHVGLMRNLDSHTVIGVIEPRSAALAERTLELLPEEVDLMELRSELPWPASVVDLLILSMWVTAATGRARGVNPGRPGVQAFGRSLYHLPVSKLLDVPLPDPVTRKIPSGHGSERERFEAALDDWLHALRRVDIGAVVLDYDGTCCPTWDRYRVPPQPVQQEIVRLLEAGIIIGFATGRGRSLHDSTRSWLPKAFWSEVCVGLYNGTCLLRLADEPPDRAGCEGPLDSVADRLDSLGLGLVVDRRRTQISVSTTDGRLSGMQLLPLVRSVASRPPALAYKALASGHSVDLIAPDAGKVAVLDAVSKDTEAAVLAIGDQGQVDGNDFDLLAETTTSLSVDRTSSDPTRCWNLDRRGLRGPDLLVRYLAAINSRASGMRFVWKGR